MRKRLIGITGGNAAECFQDLRPLASLAGELPESNADLDALVLEALQKLEVVSRFRLAEQLRVNLLVEHHGAHGREDREHMQLPFTLPLVDDGLEEPG